MEIIEVNASFISLTKNKIAIVDTDDYDTLNSFNWYTHEKGKTFYPRREWQLKVVDGKRVRKRLLMHNALLKCPLNKEIDHINGDGFDNRKSNLRIVSHRQNMQNRHTNSSSKYPGVSWNTALKKWVAQIYNKEMIGLGNFSTELEAFNKYKQACHELGEPVVCEL